MPFESKFSHKVFAIFMIACLIVSATILGLLFYDKIMSEELTVKDVEMKKQPASPSNDECLKQLEESDLVMTASTQQLSGGDASPRYSNVSLEEKDGIYLAPSPNILFNWHFEPDVYVGCTYHAAWVLMRSEDPIFEFSDQVYWYRSLGKYAFHRPSDLPSGIWHFRACLGNYEPVGCTHYSNEIIVKVP